MLILDISNLKNYYGDRLILDIKDLKVYSGDKIGLVGLNGSGKTTLLKMILENSDGIRISEKAKIGYLSQDLNILDENRTIIDNILEDGFGI